MPTLTNFRSSLCSHECEHGTHECVRHILPRTCSSSTWMDRRPRGPVSRRHESSKQPHPPSISLRTVISLHPLRGNKSVSLIEPDRRDIIHLHHQPPALHPILPQFRQRIIQQRPRDPVPSRAWFHRNRDQLRRPHTSTS